MSGEHDGLPPDESEVELSDLGGRAAERADRNRRSPRWRTLRGGGVLVALALASGALLYSVRYTAPSAPRPQKTPAAAASFLPLAGLGCVRDAAWDPTSTHLVLVGTPDTSCGTAGYSPNVVKMYQARTATLVRQLHPDAALFAALGLPQPPPVTPTPQSPSQYPQLTYDTLRWSPDSTRLAITFELFAGGYNPTTGQFQIVSGLVLLDADGHNERVLVDHQTGAQAGPAAYTVWDVQEGTTSPVGNAPSPTNAPYSNGNTLPPALSYAWRSDGSLVPGTPLSVGTEPPPLALDLAGNPDGGYSFGPWQPGQIQVYAVPVAGQQTPTYLYLYQTSFAAWSPNGRYFVNDLSVGGLLLPAGQPPPGQLVLSAVQLDQVARLPVRDAALQQALAHDLPLPVSLGPNPPFDSVPLAWRADGKVLAILNQTNGVTLRASATGRIVMSVGYIEPPPSALPPSGALGTPNSLLWSPDGHWLLLPSLALLDVGSLNV